MGFEIILLVVLVALVFEFINGFHDTANSIATVVATKVLSPRQAIVLAAVTNLLGAFWGTAVAKTIASGLVDTQVVTQGVIGCALMGGIVWNLITWYYGLPSSSTHAMVGGLVGATVAAEHNDWKVIIWSQPAADHWWNGKGILWKVIVPMITSPLIGLCLGFLFMGVLYLALRNWKPNWVNSVFGRMQLVSSATMGFMHGTNDAQKTMGIIALALVAGTSSGAFENAPEWMSFLKTAKSEKGDIEIAMWIKVVCAITMCAGTAAGGWRIIKTLGHKMVKLQPVHGFAAETVSACVLFVTGTLGIPVSTTHNVTAAIMGVGASKRLNAIKWSVVERMLWAWILTLPAAGAAAYLLVRLFQMVGAM